MFSVITPDGLSTVAPSTGLTDANTTDDGKLSYLRVGDNGLLGVEPSDSKTQPEISYITLGAGLAEPKPPNNPTPKRKTLPNLVDRAPKSLQPITEAEEINYYMDKISETKGANKLSRRLLPPEGDVGVRVDSGDEPTHGTADR